MHGDGHSDRFQEQDGQDHRWIQCTAQRADQYLRCQTTKIPQTLLLRSAQSHLHLKIASSKNRGNEHPQGSLQVDDQGSRRTHAQRHQVTSEKRT